MKLAFACLLASFINISYGQNIRLNDSTYYNIDEVVKTKDNKIRYGKTYKIKVAFWGWFLDDTIKFTENGRVRFCDTITTRNKDFQLFEPIFKFNLSVKHGKGKKLKLYHKKYEIDFPQRFGYYLLYISRFADRVNGKPATIYTFRYTNDYIVTF